MFAILRHTFAIQMQIYIVVVVGTNLATLNTFSFFKKRRMMSLEKFWHKKLWIEETDE